MAQDVLFIKMAQDYLLLKEDGYLNADTDLKKVVYHPTLNVILICTKSGAVKVLDVNSGVVLQSTCLSGTSTSNQENISCHYISGQDRILFSDGYSIGVRSDYNGVLLLDTILQRPVTSTRDDVKVELLLSEAMILFQSLLTVKVHSIDHVLNELTDKIQEARKQSKKGIKAQKWNTVCLELPLEVLKRAVSKALTDLFLTSRHSPELGVVSAVQDRLVDLVGEQVNAGDRKAMASEAKRRETFSHWPHMDYKWALPDQMAQAGFYHQPNASGDDRAMCFTCSVCLVCWERTDEPWSEHERHSPNCPFVMGEYTQNVPLSVTHATNPAIDATYRGINVNIIGTSSVPHLITTANEDGLISIFDVSGRVSRTHSFYLTQYDSHILEKLTQDFGVPSIWTSGSEIGKYPMERKITALTIVGEKPVNRNITQPTSANSKSIRPSVICGFSMRLKEPSKTTKTDDSTVTSTAPTNEEVIATLNDQNKPSQVMEVDESQDTPAENQPESKPDSNSTLQSTDWMQTSIYMVVYDFTYSKDYCLENGENKKQSDDDNNSTIINTTNGGGATTEKTGTSNVEMDLYNVWTTLQDYDMQEFSFLPNGNVPNTKDLKSMMFSDLLPGQSDELFLQMNPQQPPQQQHQMKRHSGPRIRPLELLNSETDSAQSSSLIISGDYMFMNGQHNQENNGKSISDHISDLQNSKTYNKLNYSWSVQCLCLPSNYRRRSDLSISHLQPTKDNGHVLVVLNSNTDKNGVLLLYALDFSDKMVRIQGTEPILTRELKHSERVLELSVLGGASTSEPRVSSDPTTGDDTTPATLAEGAVVLVCADGAVRIVDMATMSMSAMAKLENESFVSAVYCNSLERLCASTGNGSLHFFAINDTDTDSTEDHDEEDLFSMHSDLIQADITTNTGSKHGGSQLTTDHNNANNTTESASPADVTNRCFHEPITVIPALELRKLESLTVFEPHKLGYNPVVPICWSEIQQAQRQRRHPQHLQKENEQITKTWRLQTDTTTWDEHIFELTLPTPVSIGHVDVNFTLHASSAPPTVEITLLRQHTAGNIGNNTSLHSSHTRGHRRRRGDVRFTAVDDTVTFDQLQQMVDNPVTSAEYLRAHNADIVAGPVAIGDCLDLSEQAGCVTLTSPKLFRARYRTLLVHVKEVRPKGVVGSGTEGGKGSGGAGRVGAAKRNTGTMTSEYMGCDCLHEVSITVYSSRHTNPLDHTTTPQERSQRVAMLESNPFVQSLLLSASSSYIDLLTSTNSTNNNDNTTSTLREVHGRSLDILNWVASVRLARNRSAPGGEAPTQQLQFLTALGGEELERLVRGRLLLGDRTVAHKCMKFLVTCCEGAKNISPQVHAKFERTLFEILLKTLEDIEQVRSAGGLQWFTILLYKVTRPEDVSALTAKCIELLSRLAEELQTRSNSYHLILRSRYGLYGTPLEPELFDIEPPPLIKGTSQSVTYASVVAGDPLSATSAPSSNPTLPSTSTSDFHTNYAFNKEYLDPREVLMSKQHSNNNSPSSNGNQHQQYLMHRDVTAGTSKLYRGLLETEPLHFVCVAASDGTRVERASLDIGGGNSNGGILVNGNGGAFPPMMDSVIVSHGHSHGMGMGAPQQVGTKKVEVDGGISGGSAGEKWTTMLGKKDVNEMIAEQAQSNSYKVLIEKGMLKDDDDSAKLLTKALVTSIKLHQYHNKSNFNLESAISYANLPLPPSITPPNSIPNPATSSGQYIAEQILSPTATSAGGSSLPWQQLLVAPTQQVIVVERMHSSARRFVVLDFGQPVLLTDVFVPLCADLLSVSIDVWLTHREDEEVTRLVVATDIGTKNLVLNDLQPPPLCRYMKIIAIGRYGMSTTRCRIPTGFFYGHLIVLPEDVPPEQQTTTSSSGGAVLPSPVVSAANLQCQLNMLTMLFEDVSCRYSIACSKLKNLLHPFLLADTTSASHLSAYMNIMRDKNNVAPDHAKIFNAYQEAITYQQQHNIVRHVMSRIETALSTTPSTPTTHHTSTSTLHTISETLLELLFTVDTAHSNHTPHIDRTTCSTLFRGYCLTSRSRTQFLAANLLHRSCHHQPYWGTFLADTLSQLFSTSCPDTFPQDRVFVLLVYLVKRSNVGTVAGTTLSCSFAGKLDSTLRVMAQTLAPLAGRVDGVGGLLAVTVDLQLLGWLLLYLSLQLDDGGGGKEVRRWDWIPGEMGVVRGQGGEGGSGGAVGKCGFRLKGGNMGARKKKIEYSAHILDNTAQALSALSNHAQSLTEKLEQALNHQTADIIMKIKNIKKKELSSKLAAAAEAGGGGTTTSYSSSLGHHGAARHAIGKRRREIVEVVSERTTSAPRMVVDSMHCLVIVRELLCVLLSVDHSCSSDMFVLSFKVIARLMNISALPLSYAMSKEQLLRLIHICIGTGLPFAMHALACLIQEVLDAFPDENVDEISMETDPQPASTSWAANDILHDVESLCEFSIDEEGYAKKKPTTTSSGGVNPSTTGPPPSTNNLTTMNSNHLPSVFESDDSEIEDFLDEIFERGRLILTRSSAKSLYTIHTESSAIDQRLECGVEGQTEITLRRLITASNGALAQNIASTPTTPPMVKKEDEEDCDESSDSSEEEEDEEEDDSEDSRVDWFAGAESLEQVLQWPESLIKPWQQTEVLNYTSNRVMLASCFDSLFQDVHTQTAGYLEQILQLWLTLNGGCPSVTPVPAQKTTCQGKEGAQFVPSTVPLVPLNAESISALITTMAWSSGMSLRAWCCALQTLTLVCNGKRRDSGVGVGVARTEEVTGTVTENGGTASGSSENGAINNEETNSVLNHPDFVQMLLRLLSGTGLIHCEKGLVGPALCKAMHHFLDQLKVRCLAMFQFSVPGNKFKSLMLKLLYELVKVTGPIATRQGPLDAQCKLLQSMVELKYQNADLTIAINIFECTGVLVHSFLTNSGRVKCINIGENVNPSTQSFSGIFSSILGNEMYKQDKPVSWEALLISLMKLLGKFVQTPLPFTDDVMETESQETSQTDESKAEQIQHDFGRAVPCLADTILQHHASVVSLCKSLAACKASSLSMLANLSPQNIMDLGEPSSVGDSVFNVLSTLARKASSKELVITPILMFLSGAPQLSEPFLWFILQVLDTADAFRTFHEAGGITTLGQSLVRSNKSANTISSMGNISLVMHHFLGQYAKSDPFATSSNKKQQQQANMETTMSLVNFAPYGSIRCPSTASNQAELLIQGGQPPHRRARAPQWSYHFYPEESHTELTLQLPSAILLREVQIQPHLGHLATCPSAVALEVSPDGPTRLVPACPPLPTSGMTCIRLHLPLPEVVNCVKLRLYKPRDATNIGLTQIRLLGTSAFGGGVGRQQVGMDLSEDENHCKHSLGWLRLLHHCFSLAKGTDIERGVIARAAQVPDLLTSCCGLLLVPTHIPSLYLPNLEKVLCDLSLYDRDSGLKAIEVLLNSRPYIAESNILVNLGGGRHLVNSPGAQTACELLCQICGHQDEDTGYRLALILNWLSTVSQRAIQSQGQEPCNPAYICSIASIIWDATEHQSNYANLQEMITTEIFERVYKFNQLVSKNPSLKYSLDSLLCSLCHVRKEFFPQLLQKIGVFAPSDYPVTDDVKSMTDDRKQTYVHQGQQWYEHLVLKDFNSLYLNDEQLETIALVSRSPSAINQLLESGLPKLLNAVILQLCTGGQSNEGLSPMANQQCVASILKFYSHVCEEKPIRDWFGSVDGSTFWLPLLQYLVRKTIDRVVSESHTQLEEVCVRFLAKCCLCHSSNQHRLAKVLCEVIAQQNNGISGFLRRLILQLLLENEKVPVSIKADETLYKNTSHVHPYLPLHPAFKQTHDRALLYLGTNTTLADILDQYISFSTGVKSDVAGNAKKELNKLEYLKSWWGMAIDMSVAAGVTAKDKRLKDAKNYTTSTPKKKKRYASSESASGSVDVIDGRVIKCELLGEQPLQVALTLGQVLRMVEERGMSSDWPCLHLKVCRSKTNDDDARVPTNGTAAVTPLEIHGTLSTTLQVFSSMGGLALLAQHLPTVYPETIRAPPTDKSVPDSSDSDWVKVDGTEEIYEDIEDVLATNGGSSSSKPSSSSNHYSTAVPPHSLTAFGLFLRLPGYADVLLWDMRKALCLLRLVFGVTDDGEGGDIFQSAVAESLPTLPFEVLRQLYETTPLSTDDGRVLRKISINLGVVHLLLSCLGVFTHQTPPNAGRDARGGARDDKTSQLYWAKGTGFGTGSTQQSWNVEQALLKQRSEEEHVTVLLRVLSSYTGYVSVGDEVTVAAATATVSGVKGVATVSQPGGSGSSSEEGCSGAEGYSEEESVLPVNFPQLLASSALLPALSSYLRNDSVLDMARHIPLYRAALELLRAMASNAQLIPLLTPKSDTSEPSISALLTNMKTCVDTYASKLRSAKTQTTDKKKKTKVPTMTAPLSSANKAKVKAEQEEAERDEGLAMLMPFIRVTASIVCQATYNSEQEHEESQSSRLERPLTTTPEERYLKIMKQLQFDTFEMIQELPDGGYKFVVSHHFESNARSAGESSHPARVKRLAQEAVTLATSLPLSYSSSVFVRCDTDRLDTMKVLITGPADTPYANGCFELDVFFPPDYPNAPMMINLETTGHHSVRFNPNLYNDGKVCLSVLNTWHGRPEEKWNAQTSSFLQVLVSIQSLILVPEPYFNEPGYERSRGTPAGTQSSREYNANICQATVRWAMLEQIVNPCPCFRDVISTHFYLKRGEIIEQVHGWLRELEADSGATATTAANCTNATDKRTATAATNHRLASKRAAYANLESFRKIYQSLREKLLRLAPPEGVVEGTAEEVAAVVTQEDVASMENVEEATAVTAAATVETVASTSMDVEEDSTPLYYQNLQVFQEFLDGAAVDTVVSNDSGDVILDEDQTEIDVDIDMEKMVKDMCG